MATIKFLLTEDHLKLLKHIRWSKDNKNNLIISHPERTEGDELTETITPFSGDDLIEDMGTIIYGKPEIALNPFDGDAKYEYSQGQKDYLLKLYNELSVALDIVLYTQSFETGHFKTKSYLRHWVKY